MNRKDMLDKAVKSQLEYIQKCIQDSMNDGYTELELKSIKTNNLYEHVREWLKENSFEIKTTRSNYVPDNGNLVLLWDRE